MKGEWKCLEHKSQTILELDLKGLHSWHTHTLTCYNLDKGFAVTDTHCFDGWQGWDRLCGQSLKNLALGVDVCGNSLKGIPILTDIRRRLVLSADTGATGNGRRSVWMTSLAWIRRNRSQGSVAMLDHDHQRRILLLICAHVLCEPVHPHDQRIHIWKYGTHYQWNPQKSQTKWYVATWIA